MVNWGESKSKPGVEGIESRDDIKVSMMQVSEEQICSVCKMEEKTESGRARDDEGGGL
jgi:hypothetical protein